MRHFLTAITSSLVLATACGGADAGQGLDEPLRVRGGQFFEGELPGSPADGEAPAGLAAITAFDFTSPNVLPGQAQKSIQGRATDSAASVAIRLAGLGSGFWVVPVGAPDPQYPGELTWSIGADFSADVAAGVHRLQVVAIDEAGRAGPQREQPLCFVSRIPDNLHACNPTRAPPDVVIALRWNVDADLDLEVRGPDGRLVGPKNPLVQPPGAGTAPPAGSAAIDRDSLGACLPDGLRQENLVFQERPAPGSSFRVYANLFDACGHGSVSFRLEAFEARGEGEGRELVPTFSQSGLLTPYDATGGASTGVLIVDYQF
ncbi:MAG TPA: hypothetical protein VGD74_10380 [Vulgatibacter sp.]